MDEGKVLIVNLAKGRIGEDNCSLLGAMLVTKIQLAALSRADVPEEKRRAFYLYVDEFHNFLTLSFADILAEARKYGLNLVLAHQYLEQLDEKLRRPCLATWARSSRSGWESRTPNCWPASSIPPSARRTWSIFPTTAST